VVAGATASSQPVSDHSSPSVRVRAMYQVRHTGQRSLAGSLVVLPAALMGFLALCSFGPAWRLVVFPRSATHLPFLESPRCCFGQWTGRQKAILKRACRSEAIRRGFWVFRRASCARPRTGRPWLPWAFSSSRFSDAPLRAGRVSTPWPAIGLWGSASSPFRS
jgi:hypothetical protein